ncbi:putative membrane protein [Alkalicoccobacillus murimartini]|uniref:Membrane protein n=2 Tax=Alkalicoccobacillus murimartini TaxID=171685 RepID=A0ABT9YIS8_9BACI|nr:putative membrane protein [Alkalicoccobacillus murimartini]
MKEYVIDRMYKASAGVANAVLVTLAIGLLFETFGNFLGWEAFLTIGGIAKVLLAPAIGAGVAYQLGGNTLVIYSAMICSTVGGGAMQLTESGMVMVTGQPVSALIAALVATYVGKRVTGKTKLDLMAIPLAATLTGGIVGVGAAAVATPLLTAMSAEMTSSVQGSPLVASMVISLAWSVLLMTPASSAALAIALQMDPVSSAAALIGCTAQFAGFTAMSLRQNDFGGFLAQSLVTPKVQFPNLVKNPRLVIPSFVAAIVCAPIATMMFNFEASYELAGLGMNSLIAPLSILSTQGWTGLMIFLLMGVIVPIIISLSLYYVIKRLGWVKPNALHVEVQ